MLARCARVNHQRPRHAVLRAARETRPEVTQLQCSRPRATLDAHARRVLTHTMPGTGPPCTGFSITRVGRPFRCQRARWHPPPGLTVRLQGTRSGLFTRWLALAGVEGRTRRFAPRTELALRRSKLAPRHPKLREHGFLRSPASLRGTTLARACFVSFLRQHPHDGLRRFGDRRTRGADRLSDGAPSGRSGYASPACEAGPALSRRAPRTDCPGAGA